MLEVSGLNMVFHPPGAAPVRAVDDVSFKVETGELFTLLGPSGCGKTTTLRSIAGLEQPSSGRIRTSSRIYLDTSAGTFVPPSHRDIGMVFQSYAIWPHMNVFENVAFPLRALGYRKRQRPEAIRKKVLEALEIVELSGYEQRPATKLSGGQQQRLAFARALVLEPELLLLDEPLSNLDAKLRETMRFELKNLQKRLGVTTIYVTHDQGEALALSDTVAVMNKGRIAQLGSPEDIYERPGNQFVADFIGTSNFIPARVLECANGSVVVDSEHGRLVSQCDAPVRPGDRVNFTVRPEVVRVHRAPVGNGNIIEATVSAGIYVGEAREYQLRSKSLNLKARVSASEMFGAGETVFVELPPEKCIVLAQEETVPVAEEAEAVA